MIATQPLVLSGPRVHARIRPSEGGVVDRLLVDGRSVLARTPWAETVVADPAPAPTEADWVARWRGGWQLCFPSTGQPEPGAETPQGFHGVASQAPWSVTHAGPDRVALRWSDALGLVAGRTWQLTEAGLEVATSAWNGGAAARRIAVAEHLVLGDDLLAPLFADAETRLTLGVPAGTSLAPLDMDGRPAGAPIAWPGAADDRWDTLDARTAPRVTALLGPADEPADGREMTVSGPGVRATVTWSGLPHLLLWEEMARSHEAPWNGEVIALGIEPTSTPHGAGTGEANGLVTLEPGARLGWRTSLHVRWVAA